MIFDFFICCVLSKNTFVEKSTNAIDFLIKLNNIIFEKNNEIKESIEKDTLNLYNKIIYNKASNSPLSISTQAINIINLSTDTLRKRIGAFSFLKQILTDMRPNIQYLKSNVLIEEIKSIEKEYIYITDYINDIENLYNEIIYYKENYVYKFNNGEGLTRYDKCTLKKKPAYFSKNYKLIWKKLNNMSVLNLALKNKWNSLTEEEIQDLSLNSNIFIKPSIKYRYSEFLNILLNLKKLLTYFNKIENLTNGELSKIINNEDDMKIFILSIIDFAHYYFLLKTKKCSNLKAIQLLEDITSDNEKDFINRNYLKYNDLCLECSKITKEYIFTLKDKVISDKNFYKNELKDLFIRYSLIFSNI
ncbi:hypothetical protein TCON_1565 [Astathelohania contejeani]|uniref:Uncharacterized protein n=1 Tax=Astathelohania contejeani TaxID=164912 RepID=A0ABQ7HYK3_9MICR|nr:hypothetical protein TCON_1565 [Thelohania contejeani]